MSERSGRELLKVLEEGLSLLDQGRPEKARQVLAEAIADALGMPIPDPAGSDEDTGLPTPEVALSESEVAEFENALTDEEFEGAFDRAEAQREEMIDANHVAQEALRRLFEVVQAL